MVPRPSGAGVDNSRVLAPSDLPLATDVREVLGAGREGIVQGRRVSIGTCAFVLLQARDSDAPTPENLACAERDTLARGDSPVFIAIEGRVVALVSIGDRIREDASDVLAHLRSRGWHVRIASGDAPQVVRNVGTASGIPSEDCLGGLSPEAKLALVRESRDRATTVILGDGVNDAPALAAATVGIAVQGGAEASLAATDVYLTKPGLSHVLTLLDGADRTMRAIRWCVFASIAYNVVAAALSITGIINPLLAAIIMPMASLTVLVLALRLPTFRAGASGGAAPAESFGDGHTLRSQAGTPVPYESSSPLSEAVP
jgi:Cu2+-exporting ATPase